ncbi:MAG: cation:proton antiporter family protein [Bacteroidales bacterium]
MDPLWLSIAFILGLVARFFKLPPLVGYLIAGFLLNALGAESGNFVDTVAELGVTLLLFTIGLKLRIKSLLKPVIYAGAGIHMVSMTLVSMGAILLIGLTGFSLIDSMDTRTLLVLAFALSFSSTVFAVKVLEDKGETDSTHGNIAIGVLIMQDLFAVLFLVFAAGKIPSPWALALPIALLALRPGLIWVLKKIGHGELLILYGFFLALVVGAELFTYVGLKADLGALVIGMLLAPEKKAKELAYNFMQFKDFFLIGFFLSIGLSGQPTWELLVIAFLLALLINLKVLLYFVVFLRFHLRVRTTVFTSLALANYSEFGLIIASVAVSMGWLPASWLIVMAIALAISFVISSPLNTFAHTIYNRLKEFLHPFELQGRLTYDRTMDIGDAQILIFGMGRLGTATYDQLHHKYGRQVLALDYNPEVVEKHKKQGRRVIHDDATDVEFWEQINQQGLMNQQVRLIMLCMDDHKSNLYAAKQLQHIGYKGQVAATAKYEDQVNELKEQGVNAAFDLYAEAGIGFANHVCQTCSF